MSLKFESAYCKKTGKIISIEEITKLSKKDIKDNHSFVCPECKNANLIYNRGLTPYLSTLQHSVHLEGCSCNVKKITSVETKKFIGNSFNYERINNMLALVLNNLIDKEKYISEFEIIDINKIDANRGSKKVYTIKARRLPRKSLSREFYENDYGEFKLFYGNVIGEFKKIPNKKEESKDNVVLELYSLKGCKLMKSIWISNKDWDDMKLEVLYKTKINMSISCIGIMSEKKNILWSDTLYLKNSNLMHIRIHC